MWLLLSRGSFLGGHSGIEVETEVEIRAYLVANVGLRQVVLNNRNRAHLVAVFVLPQNQEAFFMVATQRVNYGLVFYVIKLNAIQSFVERFVLAGAQTLFVFLLGVKGPDSFEVHSLALAQAVDSVVPLAELLSQFLEEFVEGEIDLAQRDVQAK